MVTVNPYGNCEQCGTPLKAREVSDASIGRRLCTKCKASEYSTLIGTYSPTCRICGKPLGVEAFLSVGSQICNSCLVTTQLQPSIGQLSIKDLSIASTATNIGTTLGGLEKGIFDIEKISIVDPREEQITKLEDRIEELESAGYDDKEELESYKKRLVSLEKKIHASGYKKASRPSFSKLCEILNHWIPRRVRRYEESYKAELAEYLSHIFPKVREETEGQLCDILVSKQHPIHLKVEPNQGEYDTLCGQIVRTLERYKRLACVIIGISSSDQYHDFIHRVVSSVGASKVAFFPKAR